jgi:UDP-glucuronate 4-epimerase
MKIFITGIAGFIGFHVATFLKKEGYSVFGCDNFNDYYDPLLKRARASHLQTLDIPILEINIGESSLLEQWITKHAITHFLHLAAQAGVRHSISHPYTYVDANLRGFVTVLEVCRKYPHIHFVYASSSSVYGLNQKLPFSESDATDHPTNLYGASKKSNELTAHSYHHLYGLSTIGLRYFTVFGPWGRPDMAYFSFTKSILENRPISLYNEGEMARDFTYIDDIVKGTVAALKMQNKQCSVFNLGGNRPIPLHHLLATLEASLGKKATINLLPMQPGESLVSFADIEKSRRCLGFEPSVSFEEGISRFVHWYQDFYKIC